MILKICKNCFAMKPLNDFHANKAKPDGLQYVCKKCNKEKVYSYRYAKFEGEIKIQKYTKSRGI
jgi:RNase P subunit RPR2